MPLILDQLKTQILNGEVIALIGAGISIASTNGNKLASWKGLLENGVEHCMEYCSPTLTMVR